MESLTHFESLISMVTCPAFLVKDGTIIYANEIAAKMEFSVGTGIKQYAPDIFRKLNYVKSGQLHILLRQENQEFTATISRCGPYDLYYLTQEFETPELRTLASVASNLKASLSHATIAAQAEDTAQNPALMRSLLQLQRSISNMQDAFQFHKKRPTHIAGCNITEFYAQLMQNLAEKLSFAGILIEYSGPAKNIISLIDKERLQRGIINLIANTISYHATPLTLNATLHCYSGQIQFTVSTVATHSSKYAAVCSDYRASIEKILPDSDIMLGITIAKGAAFAHDGAIAIDQPDEDSVRLIMTIPLREDKIRDLHSPVLFPSDYTGGCDPVLLEFSHILPESLY